MRKNQSGYKIKNSFLQIIHKGQVYTVQQNQKSSDGTYSKELADTFAKMFRAKGMKVVIKRKADQVEYETHAAITLEPGQEQPARTGRVKLDEEGHPIIRSVIKSDGYYIYTAKGSKVESFAPIHLVEDEHEGGEE